MEGPAGPVGVSDSKVLELINRRFGQRKQVIEQHESPGKVKEPNWLPAPEGPFVAVMRLYWPKAEALNGTWKLPPLKRVQ